MYVMDANGTHRRLLLHSGNQDDNPTWSPDGIRIAYAGEDRGPGIYLTSTRGQGTVKVTSSNLALEGGEPYGQPGWSPDGTALAFAGTFEVPSNLYIINSDGTGLTRLTNDGAAGSPSWRPIWER